MNAQPVSASPPPASTPSSVDDAVHDAVVHHDANACNAALAGLASGRHVDTLRAVCMMLGGDCERGAHAYATAAQLRDASVASMIADEYCAPGNEPATRLRRLSMQIGRSSHFDCDYYLPIARDAARDVSGDTDRLKVDGALATIAKCFGMSGRCDKAREVWRDVVALNPRWLNLPPDIGRACD